MGEVAESQDSSSRRIADDVFLIGHSWHDIGEEGGIAPLSDRFEGGGADDPGVVRHSFCERLARARVGIVGQFTSGSGASWSCVSFPPSAEGFLSVASIGDETDTLVKGKEWRDLASSSDRVPR